MGKRGWVGVMFAVIGVVLFFVILAGIIVGVYFYNYYVFETVRICVGVGENTMYPCNATQDCIDAGEANNVEFGLEGVPEFIQEKLKEVIDIAIYCDGTCFVKKTRGINRETQELEMIEECFENETEISAEIRGKEGLEVMAWMKEREDA